VLWSSGTPKDYHPIAFKECDNTYYFKSRPPQLQMGTVGTAHGALTFDLQSHYINNLDELEEEIIQQAAEAMEPWSQFSDHTVSESLFREVGHQRVVGLLIRPDVDLL
jgi:hypothetical protein